MGFCRLVLILSQQEARYEHQATERRAYQNTHETASNWSLALAFLRCKPQCGARPLESATGMRLALSRPIIGIPAIGAATEPLARIPRVFRDPARLGDDPHR